MSAKKEPTDPYSSATTDADRSEHKDTHIVPAVASDVKRPTLIPYTTDKGKLEVSLFSRAPKWLFEDDSVATLSSDAKILYIAMLDRLSLSVKNKWLTPAGEPYIYYTIDAVGALLGCQHTKASRVLRELRQSGLIRRVKQGQGHPAIVYLYQPAVSAVGHPAEVNTVMPTKATAVPADAATERPSSLSPRNCAPQSRDLLASLFAQ